MKKHESIFCCIIAFLLSVTFLFSGCDLLTKALNYTVPTELEDPDSKGTGQDDPNAGKTEPANPTENLPAGKTLSDYIDGYRTLNLTGRTSGTGFIFTSTIQPRQRPDYSAIDNAVKDLVIPVSTSLEDAAKLIVQTAASSTAKDLTVKEKTRAIFTWIAYHLDYDSEKEEGSSPRREAEGAFKDRIAVCDGYTNLMVKMCKAVDVECAYVYGSGINAANKERLIKTDPDPANHAWNKVTIDRDTEQYFLCDVTWASGGTFATGKKLDDQWFDPDPCYFFTSHYSWGDENAVLVSPAVNRDDFMLLPVLNPSLEWLGIDGKELVEFFYSHADASLPSLSVYKTEKLTGVYKIPMSKTLVKTEEYEIVYDCDGRKNTKKIPSDCYVSEGNASVSDSGFYITYELVEENQSQQNPEPEKPLNVEPVFIEYDDQIEFNTKSTVDKWNVSYNYPLIRFYAPDVQRFPGNASATYDVRYQQWWYIKGTYHNEKDYNYVYSNDVPDFTDDPKIILSEIITEISSSIPLDRKGHYMDVDYNTVYVPLSHKDEVENSVLYYDWEKDDDFRDFVNWMVAHNISEEKINFYKKMAKYPYQRGSVISERSNENIAKAGADCCSYPFSPKLLDKDGNQYYAGGMQQFFEFRKNEKRHLFSNEKIPILMVHIIDSDNPEQKISAHFFENEAANIKVKLASAGFTNEFEVCFAEIMMSYKDFENDYITPNGTWNFYGSWARRTWGTDAVLAEIGKTKPELAAKFEDDAKSGLIKYFVTQSLNGKVGSINGINEGCVLDRSRLDNILGNLGYSRNDHIELFGSELKTHAPGCFDTDCMRPTEVCPLCLYSFGID